MAVTAQPVRADLLTYEQYLAEGGINRRYDIVDGVRIWMTNPTRRHERILLNIARMFHDYETSSATGKAFVAPCDVLITRQPLRTRQPDVLFISQGRLAQCAPDTDPAPLEPAPELVVEILSPNETRRAREAKITDYCAIGVQECWVISPSTESVEVLRLSPAGMETAAVYTSGQALQSRTFPTLTVPDAGMFAP
jgi:Uma2 family endonuclease